MTSERPARMHTGPGRWMEDPMAHVQDVAAYVLHARGPMSAMKLQKLCYYYANQIRPNLNGSW
jgi:hypothetical protein